MNDMKQQAPRQREAGQAIILIAMLMVALGGMVGLAIDGGGLYFLHRDTQNAVDAALLAAAYALCSGGDNDAVEASGYRAAEVNGFAHNEIEDPGANSSAMPNWVTVNSPPIAGPVAGEANYVEVTVAAIKPTFFIQFVFRGQPLRVTSYGVARCDQSGGPSGVPDAAILALKPTGSGAVAASGGANLETTSGSIFVNSSSAQSIVLSGSAYIKAGENGEDGVRLVGVPGYLTSGTARVWNPVSGVSPMSIDPLSDRQPPDNACVGTPASSINLSGSGNSTIEPGYYSSINLSGFRTITLQPGFYCFNGSINASGFSGITGDGVVLYFKNGGLTTSGGESHRLTAPTAENCDDPVVDTCDWIGMMLWSRFGNTAGMTFSGDTGTIFTGTVYAPSSNCIVSGTAHKIGFGGQIYCWTFTASGTGTFRINYLPWGSDDSPPTISIIQ